MYPVIRRRSARRLCVRTVSLYKGRRLVTVLETFVAFVSLLHDDRGEVEGSVPTSTCSLVRRARTVWDVAIVRWIDLTRPPSTTGWIESMDLDVNVYTTRVLLSPFRTSVGQTLFIGRSVLTACAVDLDVGLLADIRIVAAGQTFGWMSRRGQSTSWRS